MNAKWREAVSVVRHKRGPRCHAPMWVFSSSAMGVFHLDDPELTTEYRRGVRSTLVAMVDLCSESTS